MFRFLTGAGIGGEYSAINSAIQELIPARLRGRIDLAINGSFWVGAALGGARASVLLLDPGLSCRPTGAGASPSASARRWVSCILFLRRWIPESPRWLMLHGKPDEARAGRCDEIEARVCKAHDCTLEPVTPTPGARATRTASRWCSVARTLLRDYPAPHRAGRRADGGQAFFYNAIFFTYALVLTRFYGVPAEQVGLVHPAVRRSAISSGRCVLGPLFDTWGRKPMIAATYVIAGVLLADHRPLFAVGLLDAMGQTSCGRSSSSSPRPRRAAAYLTVGECFPLEMRALAIALFYAFGTAARRRRRRRGCSAC